MAHLRGNVDQAAGQFGSFEAAGGGSQHIEGGFDVEVNHGIQVVIGGLVDQLGAGRASVVDHDVKRAVVFEQCFYGCAVAHIQCLEREFIGF